MWWRSISAARLPISSPSITTARKCVYTKSPTTYGNFVDGILDCFAKAQIEPASANFFNHGTTLVINSLIQRRGARTALVTTAGFRDVLEIARGNRPDPFDLHYQRDEPLIPRELRFEVPERIDAKGEIVTPLDVAALEKLAEELKRQKVESVAVFFMNSYLDPSHEQRAAELLQRMLPGVYVTCSTELTREWYEYERSSTAAANAYVGPQVNTYIRRLESDLTERGYRRLALHDGLEWRGALGRAHLPPADRARRIRPDRRLHRRRRLCRSARHRECHRFRHGRHDGEMRARRATAASRSIPSITPAAMSRASRSNRR